MMKPDSEGSELFCTDDGTLSQDFMDMEVTYSGATTMLLRARRDGRWWVLKALSPACRQLDLYRNLQQKEYDIQHQFDHPHIAQAYSLEEVPGYGRCIVMEWVDGLNLRQWLATKPRRRERLKVLRQLVDAIECLHSRQVVHRDLKPENVMITRNGHNVKLIDFGLADTDSYSDFKQPSGTKGYVSPEQRVERTTDCRNDIYSLGCIITDLHLGRLYNALAQRCKAPIKQRLPSIAALKQLRKRKQRISRAVTATVAAILLALAGWGVYLSQEDNGRPRFEQVAQFQVANIKYTSWGGLVASAQLAYAKEKNVVVPASVTHDGLTYLVSELGFNSFRHDTLLRKAVVMCEADTMNILAGAFKGCNNLKELYLISSKSVGIGSDIWKCPIDSLFDAHHYNDVTLYVPAAQLQLYRRSAWSKFKHIKPVVK